MNLAQRPLRTIVLGIALVAGSGLLPAPARDPADRPTGGQAATPPAEPEERPQILPTAYPGGLGAVVPVTLNDVLRLAVLANLDIAQANLVARRAGVAVQQVNAGFLPNLNLGSTYVAHDGTIQRVEGTIIKTNRDSLFIGPGATLSFNFGDALFLPEAARRLALAARIGEVRVTNDSLLRVAEAYFEVLRARRRLARLDETLDFLTAEKESDLRGGSKGLLPLIRAFVQSGTALPSDQARVEADVVRRHEERIRAMQDVRTTAAELARLLHINALVFLLPAEDFRWPLDNLPCRDWTKQPLEVLVTQALRSRPELAENAALLEAAVANYRAAKWRPLVPNLVVGYSYGGFGGGPEVVGRTASGGNLLGNSGAIADFNSRSDFDISLVWRLQGLGLANVAQIKDARLRIEQTQVTQLQIQDLVVAQVVQAAEQVQRGFERVQVTRAGLFDELNRPTGTVYRSLRLNFIRIKGGQGLPLEVLDSTRRLSDVLDNYANALTDYDRARFRLLVALGLPPATLIDPASAPLPLPAAAKTILPAPLEAPATKPGGGDKVEERDAGGAAPDAGRPAAPDVLPRPRRLPDDGLTPASSPSLPAPPLPSGRG